MALVRRPEVTMIHPAADVRVGTSGWHYPAGKGTWNGVFYPPLRGRPKSFDELTYYAEHFNTVELNSTFYGQPRASVSRAWAERTPDGFEFSVKLYQKFTHPKMYAERIRASLAGTGSGSMEAAPEPDEAVIGELGRPVPADLDEFKRGIDPLASSLKLGALLAQFPPSFKKSDAEMEYLAALLQAFRGYAVAVELRHASWSAAPGDTLSLLNSYEAAWVQIDEPKFALSIAQDFLPNVKSFYYVRLHGRNRAQWWRHEHAEDRYNYLYSAQELAPITETANAARALVKKVYLYTNNHYSAKSVANAAMIRHQLGEPLPGEYPPSFIDRYPDLGSLVHETGRSRLV